MKKVALVYDRVNKWGGAERVLLALHRIFPQAPLYTSVYNPKKAPWAEVFSINTSFLQKFPFSTHHELYAPLMPLAFESFNFDEYDLVISVSSEAAKGIVTKAGTLHIAYMLTPTRYLWSGYKEYFRNEWLRYLSYPVVLYLRFWDAVAANRPDEIIAISEEVSSRVKKYYKREAKVIYPPLTIQNSTKRYTLNANSYFLIVSRLVPYKRIDIAVKAFNKLGLPLKIVGEGSDYKRLKRMSKGNIEFLGHLTEKELLSYYQGCDCLIFCGKEDFGLTILEANSMGKPVIAYKSGGAFETVVPGKTGLFFDKATPDSLAQTVLKFGKMSFNPKTCIKRAEMFSYKKFRNNFLSHLAKLQRSGAEIKKNKL